MPTPITNLYEYYQSKGQQLPTIQERAPLFEQYGLGKAAEYTGLEQQNIDLLGKLTAGSATAPPSPIGTSDEIRNADLKKKADQLKVDQDKASELKRLQVQAEIDRIKSGVLPEGTKPVTPNLTAKFEKLRTAGKIPEIETELTSVRNEKQLVIDELNKYRRGLEGIAGGTVSIFAGKEGEAARIAQDRLDVLNRQESLVVDKLNSKNKYIETVMNLTGQDYDNARQTYNDEYNKNLQIQQIYNKEVNETQQDAQAYLTSVTNLISNSGKSWADIDEGMKADIYNYELKAGWAPGTLAAFARSKPKANVVATSTGYDADGNQMVTIISDENGQIKVSNVRTGGKRAGGLADLTPAQQSAAFKLADDFEKASTTFIEIASSYDRISVSAKDPSAAGDLSLIFAYMKMLDPRSVVREGEFATAQNAGSVPQSIWGRYNRIITGERLAPSLRTDFIDRGTRLYNAERDKQKRVEDAFKQRAVTLGIPSEFVIRPTGAISEIQQYKLGDVVEKNEVKYQKVEGGWLELTQQKINELVK